MDVLKIKAVSGTILAICLTACSNSNDARKALDAMGFTDVRTTGYSFFSCAESDFYSTGFVAKNPQGREVEGAVCSGFLFKNSTVRFS